jgi:hypothetical protein
MNKLVSTLLGGAAVLTLSASAIAADPDQPRELPVPHNQVPAGATPPGSVQDGVIVDGAQAGATVSAKEQAYLAGLKKCETLQGEQKEQCIDAARKKAGEM